MSLRVPVQGDAVEVPLYIWGMCLYNFPTLNYLETVQPLFSKPIVARWLYNIHVERSITNRLSLGYIPVDYKRDLDWSF